MHGTLLALASSQSFSSPNTQTLNFGLGTYFSLLFYFFFIFSNSYDVLYNEFFVAAAVETPNIKKESRLGLPNLYFKTHCGSRVRHGTRISTCVHTATTCFSLLRSVLKQVKKMPT